MLEDFSVDGSLLQGFSVDAGTRPVHLLSEAHARRGFAAYINGLAHTAANRELATGDLIQIRQGDYFAEVETPSRLYELLPQLRYFALPIPVPHMQALAADPLSATLQTRTKAALRQTLQLRIDDRQRHFGSFARGNQPIVVLGPGHPALSLYMDQPLTPGFAEAVEFLQNGEYLPAGTTFRDPLVLEWTTPVFISVPPGSTRRTLLYPSPHSPHFLQVSVPPNLPLAGLPLPVRRGRHAVFPPNTESEHVIEEKPLPQERRPSVVTTPGTSLLQISKQLRQARIPTPSGRRAIHVPVPADTEPPCDGSQLGLGREVPELGTGAAESVCRNTACRPGPQVLCLESLLPTCQAVTPEAALQFPLPADIEEHALDVFDLRDLNVEVPPGTPLVPAASSFLSTLPKCASLGVPEALMLFVDGSYRDGCSAWAVVVLGCHQQLWSWLGYRSGRVPAACTGRCVFEAEVWAQLVALGIVARADVPAVIFYDSQSAAQVAHGATAGASSVPLQASLASLACYVRCGQHALALRYTPSHSGNPGNELADGLAKQALQIEEHADVFSRSLSADVLQNSYKWLWLKRVAPTMPQWPRLDDDGCTLPCGYARLPTPQACPAMCYDGDAQATTAAQTVSVSTLLLTYNTLSCKPNLQRHCLQQFMQSKGAAILALQETRHDAPPLAVVSGTIRVASAPLEGQLGCQLWLRAAAPSTFDRHRLAVVCSEPRLLIVLAHTQVCRFAIIVAHAPTSTTPDVERNMWWDHLDARLAGLPPSATPIVCCDANARFRWHAGSEVPSNANAERLQAILEKYRLCRTCSYASDGALHTTWRSPQGCPACLDYILVPHAWEAGLTTVSNLGLLDMHAGIDHDVLGARLRLDLAVPSRQDAGLDRDGMLSPWGRQAIANLFATAPLCPWAVNSDVHLQQLHAHLLQGARTLFPRRHTGPRRPVLSQQTWHLLHLRRWARRVFRRRRQLFLREKLWLLFRGWRRLCAPGNVLQDWGSATKEYDYRVAQYIRFMQQLSVSMRESTRADEASYAREHLDRARRDGPKAMANAIRAVLKHGRRYKPPMPATTLRLESGAVLTDEKSVKEAFGQHFAKSEKAMPCPFAELAHAGAGPTPDRIVVDALPSAVDLASAFAGMKCGKAAGPSLLPPELFKAAPLEAALQVMPILLKSQARQCYPLLWRGVHSIALLKPNKPPHKVESHRAIALMPTTGKAVAKACRPALAAHFESIVLPSVGGSRKAVPIELPSLLVQAYLNFLDDAKLNGGVLFLDGVAAFPSTDRSLLFHMTDDELHAKLQASQVEPKVAEHFCRAFRGKGALDRAGVPDDLIQFLRTALRGTWYSVDSQSSTAYATTCGTLPGAPNADLGFQYAAQASLEALSAHLAEEGLSARLVTTSGHAACAQPATWLDDLALLVTSPDAQLLPSRISRATSLAVQYLRLLGVDTNFAAGKTEAVLHVCGKGSQQVRHDCMIGDPHGSCPGIRVHPSGSMPVQLRCVSRYTHLGTLRAVHAEVTGDIKRRLGLAREALKPVRARLLCNPNFSAEEKRQFFFSLVLSRLLHNAGTWVFRFEGHQAAYRRGYVSLLRACVRPLCGFPCRRLTDEQVCALLGAMLPHEALACARIRVLAAVTAKGHDFLCALLLQERRWWEHVVADLKLVADVLRDPYIAQWSDQAHHATDFVPWLLSAPETANLLRRFRRAATAGRSELATVAARKAQAHEAAAQAGVGFVVLDQVRPFDPSCSCRVCKVSFSTPAAAASHMAKRHGIRAPARFAVGSACQCCMRQFWSTERLRQHLRSSPTCAGSYEGADLDAEAPIVEDPDQRLPPVPLVGPRPFWGSLHPPPALPATITTDVGLQFPANHSGSSCIAPILQHFRRLLATCGPDQAMASLAAFTPMGEYGQLAKLSAPFFVAPTLESRSASTDNLTILIHGCQMAYGPHEAVAQLGPALFED